MAPSPHVTTPADSGALRAPKKAPRRREVNLGDRVFRGVTATLAATVLGVLLFMAVQIGVLATPSIRRFGLGFLTSTAWDPVADKFGALPFVYGTVVSSVLALIIAVPIALGIAIFLTELAPERLRAPVAFAVELLAAVPSVIYGLWGVFVLAPWLRGSVEPALEKHLGFIPLFRGPSQGIGMLAAALVLAIMILPTIASVSREVLRSVPPHLREGGLALGARRWDVLRHVVLPYARSGLVGAVVLGLTTSAAVRRAYATIVHNVETHAPTAHLDGVLVAEQAPEGLELHCGAIRLHTGEMAIFGRALGVTPASEPSFALAPLALADARLLAHAILAPVPALRRASDPGVPELADLLLRLDALVQHFDRDLAPGVAGRLISVELSPLRLIGPPRGYLTLDARIVQRAHLEGT